VSTLLPSPRFREALHKASRKPEPRQSGEKSATDRSASGTARKASAAAKPGRSRRATKHAGKLEDHGDDDAPTEQVTKGNSNPSHDLAEGARLAAADAESEGDAKSDRADEPHPDDPAVVATQPLSSGVTSTKANGKSSTTGASRGSNPGRRNTVVQAVSAKSHGANSPDAAETGAADEAADAATGPTADDWPPADDTATSSADVATPDALAAAARPPGPKLGAALAGHSSSDPFGAAGSDSGSTAMSSSGAQPATTPAAVVSDSITEVPDAGLPEPADAESAKPALRVSLDPFDPSLAQPADVASAKAAAQERTTAPAPPPAPEPPPETRFAEVNHAKIVTGIHGELLPNGGAMHLRLDPPELGDLLVSVQMRDGVMTAAFQTSNDEATRLLSHSLGDLKATLEAQGVTVERLHVQQTPRQEQDSGAGTRDGNSSRNPAAEDQHHARREQQRREMVQRLWDKLAGRDAVDLTA
jgi:flagellar hook-length control protein FliK